MNTIEAAKIIKQWAKQKNLMATDFPGVIDGININQAEQNQYMSVFGHSENLFRQKQITNILFNNNASRVYILTKKALTKKDIDSLPKAVAQNVSIEYLHGGSAQAGNPNSFNPASSFTVTNLGKYTCGSSIHPAKFIGAGTLGCIVKDATGQLYGLTNNHVSGNCSYSNKGEKILAPGQIDILVDHIDPFTIGHHFKSATFIPGVPDNIDTSNNSDAALIKIINADKVSSYQGSAYDTPNEVIELQAGMLVEKVGRSTGHTQGLVVGEVLGKFQCGYTVHGVGTLAAWFDNVFAVKSSVENFSEPGDSGSLVVANVNGARKAVGILFAGDQQGNTYILPLNKILENFGVELINGHNI